MDQNPAYLSQLAVLAERLKQLHDKKRWHAKQEEVIKAIFEKGYKRIFIRKGRKGGGTQTILYPTVRIAGCFDNMACYVIGPQDALEREIIWKNNRLKKFVPKEWGVKFGEHEARAKFPNGSFIKITGANDHKSMVGIEGDVFVFDELADHDPRAYKNCYPNIASRDAIWIVVGAPPVERVKSSFYYQLEQEIKDDPDWFFIHWSTWDNAEFLPGGIAWIEQEKKRYYATGRWDEWEQRYEARYVVGGAGTVLSNFRPDGQNSHVLPHELILDLVNPDKKKLQFFQIFDPGFATCFCVLFGCYNPYDSRAFILDEIYETERKNLSVDQIWPRVVAKAEEFAPGADWKRVYDSAAPGFPQEVRSRWGQNILFQPSHKEKGDEDKYFRIINSALFTNRLLLSDRVVNGSTEMQDYATNELGNYPDKDNHFLDCLRYFFKRIRFSPLEKQDDLVIKRPEKRIITLEEELAMSTQRRNPWDRWSGDCWFDHDDDERAIWN